MLFINHCREFTPRGNLTDCDVRRTLINRDTARRRRDGNQMRSIR